MMNINVKAQIKDNIIMEMVKHLDTDTVQILDQVVTSAFLNVNMEEITTLPAEARSDIDEQNKYIINLFLYKKRNLKNGTKEDYLRSIQRLILMIDKPLTAIDDNDVSYYLTKYETRNVAVGGKRNQSTTVNNERRFLSAFFTWMRREELRTDNPVEKTYPKNTIRKPIDYFARDEIARMRDACKTPRERAIIEVLRSTGARVGEIVQITLDMIDWNTGDILICGEKGDRYRPIYLDDDARHYLKLYIDSRSDDNPSLFVHERKDHESLQICGIRAVMKQIAKRAGLKCRVYPHKMRKTLGMELKNRGVDIGIIQEIMGHASPAVTAMYYAQSTPETLRRVRERCVA